MKDSCDCEGEDYPTEELENKTATAKPTAEDRLNSEDLGGGVVDWSPLAEVLKTRPHVLGSGLKRYSPDEWRRRNEETVSKALNVSKLEHDWRCVVNQVATQVDRNQHETTLRLQLRAKNIFYARLTLSTLITALRKEINSLTDVKQRVKRAIRALENVEAISSESQFLRKKRPGMQVVRDPLEEELLQERGLVIEIQRLHEVAMLELESQLKSNTDALQLAEIQWSDKTENYELETKAAARKNTSTSISFQPGSTRFDKEQVSTDLWDKSFDKTKDNCNRMLTQSGDLRRRIDKDVLEDSVRDLTAQKNKVDMAQKRRITEQGLSLRSLEGILDQNLKDTAKMEEVSTEIAAYMRKHDYPLKVAQTRMHLRNARPRTEHTRDEPQHSLVREINLIGEHPPIMNTSRAQLSKTINDLYTARRSLLQDINEKRIALQVERRALNVRGNYPRESYLLGR